MKKRLIPVLMLVFLAGMASAADKKSPAPSVRVIRTEGKAEEFLLNPTRVTTERTVTWVFIVRLLMSTSNEEPQNRQVTKTAAMLLP